VKRPNSFIPGPFIISYYIGFILLFLWGISESSAEDGFKLLSTWGKTGEAPGQFREPMGLAFDPEGNLYVADTRNARIQKFTEKGEFLLQFGEPGKGPGEFSKPVDVVVDQTGQVYVSDYDLDRIQIFSPEGKFLRQWGKSGKDRGHFTVAAGLGMDRERRRIYLAEFYNKRVEVYDLDGELQFQVGEPGRVWGGAMNYPTDVAVDRDGNIYVADAYNHRIQKFTPKGKVLAKWGGFFGWGIPASWKGWFRVPSGIGVDSEGRIFVADSANHRMVALSGNGRVLDQWDLDLPTELLSPNRVAVGLDSRIFATDTAHDRLLVFEFLSNGD
jgi:DNA-binding beta-propeller fold protein YncE